MLIKKLVNRLLGMFGLEIRRRKRNLIMNAGLMRYKKLDTGLNTIIDVGAAAGKWSLSAKEYWPDASYVLFEPLTERKEELEILVRKHPTFHFVPAAAGRGDGEIKFVVSNDLDGSGVASEGNMGANIRTVKVRSISDEVNRLNLKGPFMVKLDTHGFEVPILEGCMLIIDQISIFIIECYGFQIADKSLLVWEMCIYMDKLGFRLFDVVDVMHRPRDGSFWQCDVFFIRKDHDVFLYNQYN